MLDHSKMDHSMPGMDDDMCNMNVSLPPPSIVRDILTLMFRCFLHGIGKTYVLYSDGGMFGA